MRVPLRAISGGQGRGIGGGPSAARRGPTIPCSESRILGLGGRSCRKRCRWGTESPCSGTRRPPPTCSGTSGPKRGELFDGRAAGEESEL